MPNIKGLGLLLSDKKIFKVLPAGVYVKKWPLRKKDQGQPYVVFFSNFIGPRFPMLDTKLKGQWPFGFGAEGLVCSMFFVSKGNFLTFILLHCSWY